MSTETTTIQQTGKSLKAQSAISGVLFFGSVFAIPFASEGSGGVAVGVMLLSLAWFLVTRVRIWWHHD